MVYKRRWLLIGIIVLIIILIGILAWYFAFEKKITCEDKECFTQSLVECKRAIYVSQDSKTITQYNILGESDGSCETNVRIIEVRKGSTDLAPLEGLDMNCLTQIGSSIMPESDTKKCHGLLKEGIQDIVIRRMYSEIVQNIGEIKTETIQVI
jgi:hypothetical protein